MSKPPELPGLLAKLWADLHDAQVLWQAGAIAACLLVAWLASRALRPQVTGREGKKHLSEALAAVLFPLSALIAALFASMLLAAANQHVLDVMVALLTAAIIIRLAVLMLQQVFAPSGWRDTLIRVIAVVVWIGFALRVAGLADDTVRFLDGLGFEVGKSRISLWLILRGLMSMLATVLIALWLGRLIEARAMAATDLDINLRVMISKLAQALLVLVAILLALPAVGIDLTVLSVFGGALGVGLGFGLQKIASNYVSGFIILLDRSVSLGDLVTIDNHNGQLTKMTARYVVVRSLGGVESIIPNDTLITSTVVNHSYTDKRVRQAVVVQVHYASDLDLALRTLEEIAQRQDRVLPDPAPKAFVVGLEASGIALELGFWVDDPEKGIKALRSALYASIWREFKQLGVEIPYPQQVVHLEPQNTPPPMQNTAMESKP